MNLVIHLAWQLSLSRVQFNSFLPLINPESQYGLELRFKWDWAVSQFNFSMNEAHRFLNDLNFHFFRIKVLASEMKHASLIEIWNRKTIAL